MSGELLLVGSIPVETAEQAFELVGVPLGNALPYMPDGEVGERAHWIDGIAYRVFNGHPEIETLKRPAPDPNGVEQWKPRRRDDAFVFRVKRGVSKVRFGDPGWRLGYARDAINSYAIFRGIKKNGEIPQHIRFQVCLPLTYSATFFFESDEDVAKVAPGMTEALQAEIDKILEFIPAHDLAIQWDLSVEARRVEMKVPNGVEAARQAARDAMQPASEIQIPKEVALGFHACFGTIDGWPTRRPPNLLGTVILLNAAVAAVGRSVEFLHFPTLGTAEDEFFAPLRGLESNGARVYVGAIHHLHGKEGLKQQIATVGRYLPKFGLAAPCGWGRALSKADKMLSEDGSSDIQNPIEIILKDHHEALALLKSV